MLMLAVALVLSACGGAQPTQAPVPAETEAPAEPTAPAAEEPKEFNMAAVLTVGLENAWDGSFIQSFKNVQAAAPHGLTITDLDYTEGVFGDEAEVVMRNYAKTGKYEVIWANSSYSDQVEKLMVEFPDILWVTVGSGNRPLGKNSFLIYQHIHECGYVQGVLAGSLTENDTIGIVGTFPADDVNDVANGFIAGAQSVNPDIKLKVTFIESWYDPPKALEAANAQIAAGVDQMYMMAESFEPCEQSGIMCYAKYIDYNFAGPNSVVSSALMFWEPHINYIIDQWWNHATTGAAYDAPMESVWFNMAEGTCKMSEYHALDSKIPQEVKDAAAKAEQDILSGALKVELNTETPVSTP
jgi:basic membrane lipoprotein Med (substrate-binding protein (PBP1-ABC) superfamily)